MSFFGLGADAYDLELALTDEIEDIPAYFSIIYVCLDTLKGVVDRGLRLVEVAIGLCGIVYILVCKSLLAHDECVHAVICSRVVGDDGVGRYIRADAASALYQAPLAHTRLLVHDGIGRQHCALLNERIACHRGAIAEDASAHDVGVMAYVHLRHQEAAIAYARASFGRDASVYYHLLADHIVIAYVAVGLLAVPAEILRVGTNDGALIDFVVFPYACASHYAGVGHYHAVVTDLDIAVDVSERMDSYVFANLRGGVNVCKIAYHGF